MQWRDFIDVKYSSSKEPFLEIIYSALQKAKDLNSLECETEKNDFKVFLLVQPN